MKKVLVKKKSRLKPFEELTIPQQKNRIVKDAISQITMKNINPTEGHYLKFSTFPEPNESLQDIFSSGENKCIACAKGAIFASCVLNVNKVYSEDPYGEEYFIKEKLIKWFTPLELDMIETAFERFVVSDDENKLEHPEGFYPYDLGEKCIKFGKRYKNPKNRLLAILNNILENKVFTP